MAGEAGSENSRVTELETKLAKAIEELDAARAEIKKLKDAPAPAAEVLEIACPACQSKISSDGKKVVKKDREFKAIEILADEAEHLRSANADLTAENTRLKGAPATEKRTGFV